MPEEEKKQRKANPQKVWEIVLVSLLSVSLLYFGGGYIAAEGVMNALIAHHLSDPEKSGDSFEAKTYYQYGDLRILKNRTQYAIPAPEGDLAGYLYQNEDPKGLVCCFHGLYSSADSYFALPESYFVEQGFDVFAVDLSSSGRSEGDGVNGLSLGAKDVGYVLSFLNDLQNEVYLPLGKLHLLGHSWGAYSVAAALNDDLSLPVSSICCFSAFLTPELEMMDMARSYAGGFASFTKPTFDWALHNREGSRADLSSEEGIRKSQTPSYLVQGDEDKVVPFEHSLYSRFDEKDSTVKKALREGYGHSSPWLSKEAKAKGEELRERYESDPSSYSLSEEEKKEANALDLELLSSIEEFFLEH